MGQGDCDCIEGGGSDDIIGGHSKCHREDMGDELYGGTGEDVKY